jgi:hypothetical protein
MRKVIGTAVVGVAVLAGGAAYAEDPPQYGGGSARPGTALTLSYLADAGFAAAVKMTCEPVGGGHPEAKAVCITLDGTGGDPSKINPTLNACVLIYAPVTAEVTGTWRGTPVAWKQRYGNTCEMRRATGALFQF